MFTLAWIRDVEIFFTREDHWAAEIKKIEDQVDIDIESLIAAKTDTEIKAIIAKVKERRANLFVQPEFTSIVVGICGQILGFGSAGFALILGFGDKISGLSGFFKHTLTLLGLFYIDMIVISLITLIWFFLQSRARYPFLYLNKLGNTIPYFYYETLRRDRKNKLWMPLQSAKTVYESNSNYLDDFKGYVQYNMDEDKKKQLKTELQQFYVLVNYQGFLDAFEMQLDHIFLYGLIGSIVSIIILNFYI
jgi:hypothetical protein